MEAVIIWVFVKSGFYSVVAYDPKHDRVKDSVFKRIAKNGLTHVLVRGRVKQDIENLRSTVPNVKVVEDPHADYAFRAVITRRQWKKFLDAATDDIDYGSHFKEVMRDADKLQGAQRYTAVQKVWSAMIDLQPYGAWSYTYSSKKGTTSGGKGVTTLTEDWELDSWWKEHGYDKDFPDADLPPEEDATPLTMTDVKRFILEESKDAGSEYLTQSEIARTTEDGFELWVRLMELKKKLGTANFHLSEDILNDLMGQILLEKGAEVVVQDVVEEGTPKS